MAPSHLWKGETRQKSPAFRMELGEETNFATSIVTPAPIPSPPYFAELML